MVDTRSAVNIFGVETDAINDIASIKLAAPEVIRSWSSGEVRNPETINYRTFKPEKGGLFCERIFGPVKDWECSCGKYKRIKHKGIVCDRCGVEVTLSRVRRDRMAHIELAIPVSHIWFFKSTPSRMGLLLDMSLRNLEHIIYYDDYVVIDPGDTPLKEKQLLSELEYREALENYGDECFDARIGAEGIRELLRRIDLPKRLQELEDALTDTKSKQIRKKLVNQTKVIEGLIRSRSRPEWMVFESLPVIPPDLRPLVPLEGGRFATSDLNDLYRRVINRNNRLKTLMALKTPEVIIRNEKRMLQQSVDALFDNGRHGRAVSGPGNRPLKSLSDMLKGKQGRFRQNLLGKRVDYSGRSVIVVGPNLKLNQCGLPKKMALVLFEPFIIRKLKDRGIVHTVRSAKKMIEREENVVWDILDEVTRGHTVMLNRAPTLHRLSIQSFEPVLTEGAAIQLHPLVCTAYNADFDGDQMAVHIPLSIEAQIESKSLMLAPNSIFSPASGKPVMTPTQDVALGNYFLTSFSQDYLLELRKNGPKDDQCDLPLLGDINEVHTAFDEGALKLHDRIRYRNPDFHCETKFGEQHKSAITTTVGRVFFNEVWPESIGFVNDHVTKKLLETLIEHCYKIAGQDETVLVLDRLKDLGFALATVAGISIGLSDMIIPPEKADLIATARKEISAVENKYKKGLITDGERYNMVIDQWTDTNEKLTNKLFSSLERNEDPDNLSPTLDLNPVFLMVDSGARGSRQQIRQLAGMRGLMAKPSGEIIERPILANFREGLSVLEYFISTHGARKGLADTALKTADSGYLTRKLVDVAHDIIIMEEDCHTLNGIEVRAITDGDEELVSLSQRVIGRTVCEDIFNPHKPTEIIVASNEIVDEHTAKKMESSGVEKLRIRSVLTCESGRGVCARCYGRNLASGKKAKLGEPVGIIAAQSIGEPGTQLTMRTFHIGGTASSVFKQPKVVAKENSIVRYENLRTVQVEGGNIVLSKNGHVVTYDDEGCEMERYSVAIGAVITVENGDRVKKGKTFVSWDPYSVPILSEQDGTVKFHDFMEGVTVQKAEDETTGVEGLVVLEHKEDLHPQIVVNDADGQPVAYYSIPAAAHVMVSEGMEISAGSTLAKTPRKQSRTKDITGGLPRVAELVEARRPKEAAEIAKIDGVVELGGVTRGKRQLIVRDLATETEEEHMIPMGKHVTVYSGDLVQKGQQLTDGPIVPHELLEVCGPQELQEYLVNEVQAVYRLQGVEINDKHIEVIVRQMLRKVKITEPGDTEFLWGEQIGRQQFQEVNQRAMEEGRRPAEASPVLLGITKAALATESFISAASFQDTTRVLTQAATLGRVDQLRGFKENVIMGHLIPAGSGFSLYKNIRPVKLGEEIGVEDVLGSNPLDPSE